MAAGPSPDRHDPCGNRANHPSRENRAPTADPTLSTHLTSHERRPCLPNSSPAASSPHRRAPSAPPRFHPASRRSSCAPPLHPDSQLSTKPRTQPRERAKICTGTGELTPATKVVDLMGCYAPRRPDDQLAIQEVASAAWSSWCPPSPRRRRPRHRNISSSRSVRSPTRPYPSSAR